MVHFIQYSTFMHSMVQLTFIIIYKIYVKTVILATGYICGYVVYCPRSACGSIRILSSPFLKYLFQRQRLNIQNICTIFNQTVLFL